MKRFYFFLFILTTLFILVLGVSVAMARPASDTPPFPTYSSSAYPCKFQYSEATKVWDAGSTSHGRNIGMISVGATDDGMYQVRWTEDIDWDANLKKFEGNSRATITQEYTNHNGEVGYWVGTIEGRLYAKFIDIGLPEPLEVWFAEGKGVFDGEGLFEGLRMKSAYRQELNLEQPEECSGDLPLPGEEPWPVVTLVDHYVIETTGTWPPGE